MIQGWYVIITTALAPFNFDIVFQLEITRGCAARYLSVGVVSASVKVIEKVSPLAKLGECQLGSPTSIWGMLASLLQLLINAKSCLAVSMLQKPIAMSKFLSGMKLVLVAVKVSEYALVASNGPDAVTVILGQSANTEPGSPITTEVAVRIAQSRRTDFRVAVCCGWRGCCADSGGFRRLGFFGRGFFIKPLLSYDLFSPSICWGE
jgi:hypothetical protein